MQNNVIYTYPLFLNQYKVLKMKTHLESFRAQTVALDNSARYSLVGIPENMNVLGISC